MHIYIAALYSNNYKPGQARYEKLNEKERNIVEVVPNILESFHYVGKQKYVDEMRADNAKIFLDSGAFSAHTLGVKLDVGEYCEYIKRNMDILRVEDGALMASVLDGIGDPLQTYRNQLEMEARGVRPLPCFHYGEDERYLEHYLANYDYITIGGMVGKTKEQLITWLDRIWDRFVIDGSGNPRAKLHGFGITTIAIMERYPWHCMTEENHEVLTKSGWKSLSDLSIGQEILCFDKGNAFWDKINNIPIFEVKDAEIRHLYNRNFEAYVSPNHRWLTKERYSEKWRFRYTDDLILGPSNQKWLVPRIGQYKPPEQTLSNEFVELAGWFWTDGTIVKRKNRGYKEDCVAIYQSKTANPEKVDRIRNVLKSSNESFCETHNSDGMVRFDLYSSISRKLLLMFPEKHLTWEFIFSLSKEQLDLFIDVSVLGDGTKGSLTKGKTFQLTQKSDKSIAQFQVACLLAGIPANLNNNGFNSIVASNVTKIDPSKCYMNKTNYSGRLWCVQVNSGAFFTRCNGRIYVTGNSCDSSSWIQGAAFGTIVHPKHGALSVSEKSPSRHDKGRHVSTLTPIERNYVFGELERQGFSYERLSTVYESRAAYNLWSYCELNHMMSGEQAKKTQIRELF